MIRADPTPMSVYEQVCCSSSFKASGSLPALQVCDNTGHNAYSSAWCLATTLLQTTLCFVEEARPVCVSAHRNQHTEDYHAVRYRNRAEEVRQGHT